MEKEKSKAKDLNYPLKLWILTLFIAPILSSFSFVFPGRWPGVLDLAYLLFISTFWLLGLGFIFSLPALVVIWSLYRAYILLTKSALLDYIVTVLLSIISVFASFKLLLGGFDFDTLAIVYMIAIPVAAVVLYVRQKRKKYKTTSLLPANSMLNSITERCSE